MYGKIKEHLSKELADIKAAGLYKDERIITSEQGAEIRVASGQTVLNFCANNYLGFSANPKVIDAARKTLDNRGYGMSSVRFICGTQDIHKELEKKLAAFHQLEDTILYAACFDANGGAFEPLLSAEDAIISDELNHASIIDGVRLCKAMRFRYKNNDMTDLEAQLKAATDKGARFKLIVTDGVFSMDGIVADLKGICDLADKYDALVMVDESHSVGVVGPKGQGAAAHCGVADRVDIITGTLGKALGGAMGGYTTSKKEIVDMLRQRSRPYLFSNSLAPAIVGASIKVLDLLTENPEHLNKLHENVAYFKEQIGKLGFDIVPGDSAIVPVMLYEAQLAQTMAEKLLAEGIYVIGFSYPVVPKDKARIRVQISAAHEKEHIDKAIKAFAKVGKKLGVIK